ncbi:MAG TPA: PAS domain S-box protein [Syntrophorhabdales bacterium]|nr:PAS domain S-box protein [Syntrophorhabdales bacterium]
MATKGDMERALREAEEKYRHIFENAIEGIFQASTSGRFTSANPALARLHGYSSPSELIEEVTSIRDQVFLDPERHSELIRLLLQHDAVTNFEARTRRKDGGEQWVSMNVRAFRNDEGRIVFYEGTMEDITQRKEGERALAESEERYRTVIEHSNDGIAFARAGVHEYVNPRFVEMFGYDSPEELIGKPITLIVHPDDRERVVDIHARRWRGQSVPARYEHKGVTKAGATIYVEVSATEVTYRNEPVLLVFLRDISERKRAEEVFLQSHRQLEQLNEAKTKAVNHISHELKTPLAVIQGNVRVLRRRLELESRDGKVEAMLAAIERGLERLFLMEGEADEILRTSGELEAEGLVGELIRLREKVKDLYEVPPEIDATWEGLKKWMDTHVSRIPDAALQVLDLNPFLLQAVEKAGEVAPHRQIHLKAEGTSGARVLMEPTILREVIDGLIRNAIENTPDRGFVTVWLEEKDETVLIHVTDCGVGISEENQQYIFDGLFHTGETERYASRKPYDFDAGGKGLDLLRMKAYAGRFGFGLSVKSTRCRYLPGEGDVCAGDISRCPFCKGDQDCVESGGTTFTVSFTKSREE